MPSGMFHVMYLKSLCERRNWPAPVYQAQRTPNGWMCTARVNGRDFSSESELPDSNLAMDMVASKAYNFCRDFSKNTEQTPNRGSSKQGMPTAIGTGRHGGPARTARPYPPSTATTDPRRFSSSSGGSLSDRRSSISSSASSSSSCPCGQPLYSAFDRCQACLRREKQRLY